MRFSEEASAEIIDTFYEREVPRLLAKEALATTARHGLISGWLVLAGWNYCLAAEDRGRIIIVIRQWIFLRPDAEYEENFVKVRIKAVKAGLVYDLAESPEVTGRWRTNRFGLALLFPAGHRCFRERLAEIEAEDSGEEKGSGGGRSAGGRGRPERLRP